MKKLTLNKETIRKLTTNEMRAVAGGQFDFRKLTDDPVGKKQDTFDCDPTFDCPTVGACTGPTDCLCSDRCPSFDCD